MSTILGVVVGVGLSAACGFRVFLPLLLLSLGVSTGRVHPGEGWVWIGSTPALIVLCVATVVELIGYLIPWIDHALDALAIPLATTAGTVLTAGYLVDLEPTLRWSLGLIAGGGTAGGIRAGLTAVRAGATATTGGVGNPLLGIVEGCVSILMTVLAILAPIVALPLIAVFFLVLVNLVRRVRRALDLAGAENTEPVAP
jgi:hypothetical protein